jgi:tyrosine-protein kinase Etk/Wzc
VDKHDRLDFLYFLEILLKWWKIIIFNVLTITLIAIVVSLVLPKKWTATAVILPPSASSASLNVEDVGSAYTLSSMALSALPGIISPSDVIVGMLQSETIMYKIIEQFNLIERYHIKNLDGAYTRIRKMSDFSTTPEQMVRIEVTTEDPQLSAVIANTYVEEIDKFNREVLMTTGKQFRLFLEERLADAEVELAEAAESLKVFQEKHRVFSLEAETKKSVELIGTLQGQIIAKKVQLNALKSYSYWGNPQIVRLQKDIAALEKQLKELEYGAGKKDKKSEERRDFGVGFSIPLSEVPEVGLKLTQLEMDLEVKKTIYSLIAEQYEKARIVESKDTPTITILDPARAPDLRSFPRRKKIVVAFFFVSLLYGFGIAIVCETFQRVRANTKRYGKLFDMLGTFASDIRPILEKLRIRKRK